MDNLKEFYRELYSENKEDIIYPFDELIDKLGFDTVYILSESLGGSNLYIPKLRKIFKVPMDKQIKKEFDGGNYLELSRKYGLCERSIRNIINEDD